MLLIISFFGIIIGFALIRALITKRRREKLLRLRDIYLELASQLDASKERAAIPAEEDLTEELNEVRGFESSAVMDLEDLDEECAD